MPLRRTPPTSPRVQHCSPESKHNKSEEDSKRGTVNVTQRHKRKRTECNETQLNDLMSEMKLMFEELKAHQKAQDTKMEKISLALEEIRTQNISVQNTAEFLANKFECIQSQIEKIEADRCKDLQHIQGLEDKLENIERHKRASCIEIKNIPYAPGETKQDLLRHVSTMAKVLNTHTDQISVRDIFRISKKDSEDKTIIVDFTSVLTKELIIRKYKEYNKYNKTNKLSTESMQIRGLRKPVFISENLTPKMKRLLYLSKDYARTNNYDFSWVSNGKIFLRKKEGTAAIPIRGELDLTNLKTADQYDMRLMAEMDPVTNVVKLLALRNLSVASFKVDGRKYPFHPPYVTSIKINGVENCLEPNQTYFEQAPHKVHTFFDAPNKFCGRRRANGQYTELIVSGSETNYGDWPWHAAVYRLDKSTFRYICGGTLISKYFILTAAHCATIRGQPVIPDILGVFLGKHSLIGTNRASIEKKVYKVIPYDEYNHKTHTNDIALLKLRTEAIFNNFVQPACLWYNGIDDHMGLHEFTGSVVGWGFDNTDSLALELRQAELPQVSDLTCIKFQPIFYSAMLDGTKFCAGNLQGTSACNGDSGGGFLVFVNDITPSSSNEKEVPGAWYIRGIVSTTLARKDAPICDPQAYAVFTDVSKYTDWIENQMSTN